MTLIDPELKKYMRQQQMQQWLGSMAQGLIQAAGQGRGLGAGLLQGLGSAKAGGGMDMLRTQAQLESLTAGREERKRAAEKAAATKELLGRHLGTTYEPESGMMWNQAERAVPGSAGMADIDALGPQTAGPVPPVDQRVPTDILMAQADPEGMLERLLAPPKDPLIRAFTEGDETVTKRFNRETKEWEELTRGPRYKTGTTVNVEAADISGLSGLMTETQRGQEVQALKESRGDAVAMVDQGYSLINSLREGGNQAVSWSGALSRGVNTLASQGEAIASNFGIQMGDGSISKTLNENDWDWGELDEESSVIKSKILGLAVAITKADQGSRPSDFDVQTSIQRIAGNSGSAATTAAVVEDLLNEKMRGFSHRYNLAAPDYELAPFNWDETLGTLGIERPAAPIVPEFTQDQLEREMQRRGLVPGG